MFDNDPAFVKWLLSGAMVLAIIFAITSVRNIRKEVPAEDRAYMDPLPPLLRLIWPLVRVFAFYVGQRLPTERLEKYNSMLRRSGITYLMSADEFFGLKIVGTLIATLLVVFMCAMLESYSIEYVLGGAILGWFLPSISLNDFRKKREMAIVKALPTFLDFLTMGVQAGMNVSGAIGQAVEKGPEGPLRQEFEKVIRDVRAGMSRVDALKAMAERLEIREITTFVTAIAQAEKTGASLTEALRIQADQRRVERFQRAEKLAMEAPVKLIFPLVVFIFPMTFIILGFPIAMKFMYEL